MKLPIYRAPIYDRDGIRLYCGDLFDVLPILRPDFTAIITDPPYGLEFMGNEWDRLTWNNDKSHRGKERQAGTNSTSHDYGMRLCRGIEQVRGGLEAQLWHQQWTTAALKCLLPGGMMLAFGGSRTSHRLACAIEDSGWEIRDTLLWLYGSGFPKSLDISKAMDKAAGVEREIIGYDEQTAKQQTAKQQTASYGDFSGNGVGVITAPKTPEAQEWDGYGTGLKPAFEPIIMAMKPIEKSFVHNALTHGVAGLNIDACRVQTTNGTHRDDSEPSAQRIYSTNGGTNFAMKPGPRGGSPDGRWPANVILDEVAAAQLDEQTGVLVSRPQSPHGHVRNTDKFRSTYSAFAGQTIEGDVLYGDLGGASRFFYVTKASTSERGLIEEKIMPLFGETAPEFRNTHPTVKPIELMVKLTEYLTTLVTMPKRTLILDLFAGSGTTLLACKRLGMPCIGIEKNPEYCKIILQRLSMNL